MVELSIVQLVVISGIHLYYLSSFVERVIKHKKSAIVVNIVIFMVLTYFLNFSYSILRSLLMYVVSKVARFKKINKIDKLSLVGIIMILICPNCLFSLSFQMTMVASFSIIAFSKIKKNIYFGNFFQSIFVSLMMFPLVMMISKKYSILSIFYCYFFTWIYIFNFFVFLLLFWCPHITSIFAFNYYLIKNTIDIFMKVNVQIKIGISMNYLIPTYYVIMYFIYLSGYRACVLKYN